jgi:hypothetical protein
MTIAIYAAPKRIALLVRDTFIPPVSAKRVMPPIRLSGTPKLTRAHVVNTTGALDVKNISFILTLLKANAKPVRLVKLRVKICMRSFATRMFLLQTPRLEIEGDVDATRPIVELPF